MVWIRKKLCSFSTRAAMPRRAGAILAGVFLLAAFGVCVTRPASAAVPAFPGAVGFGAAATGGRGGTIYHVTNLNDTGTGSFRDAVSHSMRIVVFDVGGYIQLHSAVSVSSNITIAGQTAPGDGIGIFGSELSLSNSSNIIIRYFRIRDGTLDANYNSSSVDSHTNGVNMDSSTNVILDHVSIEFAAYNNIDAVGADMITVQNSILADPIQQQFNAHTEQTGGHFTWYNTIFANSHNRNPLAKVNTQCVNCVNYNFQAGYTVADTSGRFSHDIINNYFIAGPSTTSAGDDFYQMDSNQTIYSSGNILDSDKGGTLGGSSTTPGGGGTVLTAPWSPTDKTTPTPLPPTTNAADGYAYDVAFSGDLPRDGVDALVIGNVTSLGKTGQMWGNQSSTGLNNSGYGTLNGGTMLRDADGDGMPDVWEQQYGLNPGSSSDMNGDFDGTGYTNIEKYINGKVDGSYPIGTPVSFTGKFNGVGITPEGSGNAAGMDGKGNCLSGFYLNGSYTIHGYTYNLGTPGSTNILRPIGQTLLLPAVKYATLTFLGAATHGSQLNQKFVVRYTDGTTDTFTQSFSDWTTPSSYLGEVTALTSARRNKSTGAQDYTVTSLYQYVFSLNATKTVKSVTLPNNSGLALLAMDLVPAVVLVQPGATYELVPLNAPALALTVAAGGSTVDVETITGATSQQWTITDAGSGYYRLTPASATGNALTVTSTMNSSAPTSAASNSGSGQLWQIIDLGTGAGRIEPKLDTDAGLNGALDVAGSHTTSGSAVDIYQIAATATGGTNEQWQLIRLK